MSLRFTGSGSSLVLLFSCLSYTTGDAAETRRPIYVIGHMVNSIPEITEYLDRGANVLESDISFFENGTVNHVYHGFPADCGRDPFRSANLSQYLDYVRTIADPKTGKYSGKQIFQFFDLKLSNVRSDSKETAGREMADHVLNHLWKNTSDGSRVRALIYINDVGDNNTVVGFRERFKERRVERLLKDVGYDGGVGDSKKIEKMWKSIGVDSNIWQGDGTTNCFVALYPNTRLKQEVAIRNKPNGYISKVYHWTIDLRIQMIQSLILGVDGMITNFPEKLVQVLSEFSNSSRLATVQDDPFAKFLPGGTK